jgi:hypothetical protein
LAYLSNTCWPLACCRGKRDLLRTKRDLLYIGIPEQYLLAPSLLFNGDAKPSHLVRGWGGRGGGGRG